VKSHTKHVPCEHGTRVKPLDACHRSATDTTESCGREKAATFSGTLVIWSQSHCRGRAVATGEPRSTQFTYRQGSSYLTHSLVSDLQTSNDLEKRDASGQIVPPDFCNYVRNYLRAVGRKVLWSSACVCLCALPARRFVSRSDTAVTAVYISYCFTSKACFYGAGDQHAIEFTQNEKKAWYQIHGTTKLWQAVFTFNPYLQISAKYGIIN